MHTHYVNGGLELAARTGGIYVLSVDESVLFEGDRNGPTRSLGAVPLGATLGGPVDR